MKTCKDLKCETCGHSMTRHQKPAQGAEPDEVVCFECLYGPRGQRQR